MKALNEYAKRYLNRKLVDVIDEITEECSRFNFSVNVLDPVITDNIDVDYHRLNLRVDDDTIIKEIFIG